MTIQAITKIGAYSISDITPKSIPDTEAEDLLGSRLSTSLGSIVIPSSSIVVGSFLGDKEESILLNWDTVQNFV